MSPRTSTLFELDDKAMWRKEMALHHPDRGGDHESFIWIQAVRDFVCERVSGGAESSVHPSAGRTQSRPEPSPVDPDRIPWSGAYDFQEVTRMALLYAALDKPYAPLLSLLADCQPLDYMVCQQSRGASYRQLAAIGHAWGMIKRERVAWYRAAEDLALTDRHASHLLGRLKRRAA
jgi:hypothetical protein